MLNLARGRTDSTSPDDGQGSVKAHRQLLAGSAVLVIGAAIQAGTGAVFWLIAAHLDVDKAVGAAGKLSTSVLFVTYLAGLGLPVALARYAAVPGRDSDVTFTWGVLATTAASLAIGFAYFVLIPGSATELLTGPMNSTLGAILFGVIIVGSALSMIVDVRCMTARRWNLVLVRITVVGLCRLPLLWMFRSPPHTYTDTRALWLFLASAGPAAVSGILGVIWVPRVADGRHRMGPKPKSFDKALRYSGVNYLSTLAYQAPYFLLPVIVLASVPDQTFASFNVAWGIVAVAFYVPSAIGQALLAEGGKDDDLGATLDEPAPHDESLVRHQVRIAMWFALGLMTLGAVATYFGKNIVTELYGPTYRDAARILPVMVAAGIPWAITSLYLAEVRVLHRHVATVVITGVLTLAIILPAAVLVPHHGAGGIDGASASWFLGNMAAAVVAIVAVRFARREVAESAVTDVVDMLDEATQVGISMAEHRGEAGEPTGLTGRPAPPAVEQGQAGAATPSRRVRPSGSLAAR